MVKTIKVIHFKTVNFVALMALQQFGSHQAHVFMLEFIKFSAWDKKGFVGFFPNKGKPMPKFPPIDAERKLVSTRITLSWFMLDTELVTSIKWGTNIWLWSLLNLAASMQNNKVIS